MDGYNKDVSVHFSSFNLLISPNLYPKPPWHIQAAAAGSGGRQSLSFPSATDFLDVFF